MITPPVFFTICGLVVLWIVWLYWTRYLRARRVETLEDNLADEVGLRNTAENSLQQKEHEIVAIESERAAAERIAQLEKIRGEELDRPVIKIRLKESARKRTRLHFMDGNKDIAYSPTGYGTPERARAVAERYAQCRYEVED